jgi:hypothetical protein
LRRCWRIALRGEERREGRERRERGERINQPPPPHCVQKYTIQGLAGGGAGAPARRQARRPLACPPRARTRPQARRHGRTLHAPVRAHTRPYAGGPRAGRARWWMLINPQREITPPKTTVLQHRCCSGVFFTSWVYDGVYSVELVATNCICCGVCAILRTGYGSRSTTTW